ncbi:MAG: hypothetical protein EP330_04155 [Deltaproteobacteria bacterium]|nr:MAG: hypothetical protein EP330_04155 [Deltaproteobacteria bacterium]
MLSRFALIAALSLASTTAFAFTVPLSSSRASADPGPHPAGQPIPCTATDGWGNTYSGTVVTIEGTMYCTGMVAPADDDAIDAAPYELTREVFAEWSDDESEVLLVNAENNEVDDLLKNLGGTNDLKKRTGI